MKKAFSHLIPALILILVMSHCSSEKKTDPRLNTFRQINREVLENSKAYSTLKEATTTIGHRLTGSANGKRVEEYTYNKFRDYGFQDVRYDSFEVKAWSRGDISVLIDGKEVHAVTLGHSPLRADITGELVDAHNGLERDYDSLKISVDGKIALIYLGLLEGTGKQVQNLHRSEKAAIAIRHGAKGLIFYNQVDKGVLLTGTASVSGQLIEIPAVCIGKEAGMEIREKIKHQKVIGRIRMTNHSDLIKARNIIATLRGSELPDERVIIGGHLDSWDLATGAIDNGIGSFSVLDIARSFKASHLAPKRTVQFILFMGEEQGLLGSRHRVAKEVESGTIDQIKYMMNLDMSGNPIGIHAGGNLDDTLFFRNLGAAIHEVDTVFSNKFSNGPSLHSDHQPFMLEGVPVLGVIGNLDKSIFGCYHADCDDFSLVNEDHLRNMVRFGTMIMYGLANADKMPAHKMDSEATKEFMIKNHLKDALVLGGDWRWGN